MSRIILNTKTWLLFVLLFGISFSAWAQSDDFNTWTKFKVNHKIDSRFSVSGDLELRMKDDVSKLDRWGLTVGNYLMLLQKELFLPISLLKSIRVWMTFLFGEPIVCVIVPE